MSDWYILEEHTPRAVDLADYIEWTKVAKQEGRDHRRVALSEVRPSVFVSTVFLGLDHGFGDVPILFETMIYDDDGFWDYQNRYMSWEQAELGHEQAVDSVRKALIVRNSEADNGI